VHDNGGLQYLVEWNVEAVETEADEEFTGPNTWEAARKLRFMGLEMLCVAFDSLDVYNRMAKRPLHMAEVVKHLKSVGIMESVVHQPIRSFSAGQMSKLVLAAALWTKPHMLMLDEPTNFIDVETVEALAKAIKSFQGGVVVVSHNAEFLQETCNEIWQIEDGHLAITGKDGCDKGALVREKLAAQAARDKEQHTRELEMHLASLESKPEDVGRIISKDLVFRSFKRFIGFNLPDHAVQLAVDTFVSVAEERQPSRSDGWLAAIIAAVQMVESIGYEELGDMNHMSAIVLALLRNLIRKQAVGSIDTGEELTLWAKLHSMHYCEKVTLYEECCYCGRGLDKHEIETHEKECRMSPARCGRHLEGSGFEMFHGTSADNAASIERNGFKPSGGGMLGPGVYCSRDLRKARRYGGVVLRLCVHLGRVITIDRQGHPLQRIWQTQVGGSFDAAWVPPNSGVVPSGLEENCVRSPDQIVILGRVKLDGKMF